MNGAVEHGIHDFPRLGLLAVGANRGLIMGRQPERQLLADAFGKWTVDQPLAGLLHSSGEGLVGVNDAPAPIGSLRPGARSNRRHFPGRDATASRRRAIAGFRWRSRADAPARRHDSADRARHPFPRAPRRTRSCRARDGIPAAGPSRSASPTRRTSGGLPRARAASRRRPARARRRRSREHLERDAPDRTSRAASGRARAGRGPRQTFDRRRTGGWRHDRKYRGPPTG